MVVDFRSDTVTQPSAAMRTAMATAEVGDDVYSEDPTVNRLERRVARMLGRVAAVFVPSGTMANQIAIMAHCQPGDEVVVEASGHCYNFETGATAALGGVQVRPVHQPHGRGAFGGQVLQEHLRPDHIAFPRTTLVCIENTANAAGGTVWPAALLSEVAQVVAAHGIAIHIDGARLFNAALATLEASAADSTAFAAADIEEQVRLLAGFGDSVSICLSKGLGAPVGSLLAGSEAFVHRARRLRKRLGGGMRQVGILAAAGLYALDHNLVRLGDDHRHARQLAAGLAGLDGWSLLDERIDSNIVMVRVAAGDGSPVSAAAVADALARHGVLTQPFGPDRMRFVTHLDISRAAVERALLSIARLDLNGLTADGQR